MKELRTVCQVRFQFFASAILTSARTEERELFSSKEP
jgi:hypothetical protein